MKRAADVPGPEMGGACCSVGRRDGLAPPEPSRGDPGGFAAGQDRDHASSLVLVPGGTFLMGTDAPTFPQDGESPAREVEVAPFYIDRYAVDNDRFARFVEATGYVTDAERYGWSFVFHLFLGPGHEDALAVAAAPWWVQVHGATWRTPEGPGSSLEGRSKHPVVHVSWNDAKAYAEWASCRLPTEAEWEFAARGGLTGKLYPWGDDFTPGGRHRCNTWQGTFPTENTREDGYLGTAPVDAFEPNGFGLYNMVGNVWEWCSDWWTDSPALLPRVNSAGPPTGVAKVTKGGSYLCHRSYCNRYRVAARTFNTPDSSTGHMGFRLARDA